MVIREWRCNTDGTEFESEEPICPSCKGEDVRRIFKTAPAARTSGRTARMDKLMADVAADYGMTDMSNSRTGRVAGDAALKHKYLAKEPDVPNNLQGLVQQRLGQIAGQYKPPENAVASDKPTPVKPGAFSVPKPRPSIVGSDK